MSRVGVLRRHRAAIASGIALTIASSAMVAYAVTSEGYKKHEADLNDGGVWVVNGKKGWSGRLNKPINQLDGVVPSLDGKARLDIIQDGAAVLMLNLNASRGQALDTSRLELQNGGIAALPAGGDVWMAGGTLASADVENGDVWAARYDNQVGAPLVASIDRQTKPLVTAGEGAAMTVSASGTIVVTSTEEGTLTTIAPTANEFAEPTTQDLSGDAGQVSEVTTVGSRIVTLDSAAGVVSVVDGPTASVPTEGRLQQPGPAADSVLIGTSEGLLSMDLTSGDLTTVSELSGTPVAPVRLGACVFGAWSGGLGARAVQCGNDPVDEDPLGGSATDLSYRVNRGEIVLNDAVSGTVWDVQQDTPQKVDNWEAFTSKKKDTEEDDENENQSDADRRPPQAKPDSYGVRPGRTTVLHPLDNDSAPQGRLLSIVDVDQPEGGGRVEISPDGQSLILQMPDDGRAGTFEYFIDDGRTGVSAHARVDVSLRSEGQNEAPSLRAGYEKPTYRVPHAGALSVPVLSDWRDDSDGDTLILDSARAVGGEQSGAVARTTSDGRIRLSAPTGPAQSQQLVQVEYAVSDGKSEAVQQSLTFQVQAPKDQKAFAPQASPDVVRGEVGEPIRIRPLLNDLPGSDPNSPDAELSLGGRVPQPPGTRVVTDLESGQVTMTADRAGTYFLNYDAGYGNAPLDQGTIRVDVKPSPKRAADPIAMPDTLTIYGQAPGVVDVLANDLDPAGGLLVVQRAEAERPGQLDVAIIDGRWLRISAIEPDIVRTQTVSYTISNGSSSGVRGEVVVTQREAPADNTPITASDRVVVRAGSAVSVPVLDNDISPSGDRLTLLGDLIDSPTPGELAVTAPIDVTGDVGKAFVSGRVVRYIAPDAIDERDTYDITYVAQNLDGQRANGNLKVTVIPADEANDPPEPPTLEGRVVSGDRVKVRVPSVGVDRNGDPVTVTGITSAPRLGRIISAGGNFIEYQAYPRTVGTDTFTYSVVDSQGAFATGTARVAVVEPTQPQPPLAVADRLTVEPGRTATFDPLANDFVASGDSVQIELLDPPEGVELDPDTNLVSVPAPDDLQAPPVVVVYRVTNGVSESRSTMTLSTAAEFNNPPVIYDAFGQADDSGSVVVDVLEGAYDPDGPAGDLEVTRVAGDPSARVVDGAQIRVDRGPAPKVLPFEVTDADGGAAAASVYVPPTGNGLPYVLPDAQIRIDSGGSMTGELTDYIAAPDGAEVRLASGRRSYSASPAALNVTAQGQAEFELTSATGYRGLGAVLVEVTTATDASGNEDAATVDDGATAVLSIPVQVGDDAPTLECPTAVIPIAAGQTFDLDIATFCKVFTLDPRDAAGLDYSAEWTQSQDGLSAEGASGSVVPVVASESATQGGDAVLTVRAGESNTQEIRFRLAQAPAPRLSPIRVETMEAGQTRTINIAPYLQSGVPQPTPRIVSVENTGNPAVTASVDGGRLTLRASNDARGVQASFRLSVSDIDSSDPPPARVAQGRIEFQVIGTPSVPGEPRPYQNNAEVGTIKMSWAPPQDDGGAPIQYYQVKEQRTGAEQRCDTNECVFRQLKTGGRFSFRVRAYNRVGASDWSAVSRTAQADTAPGRVRNIEMVSHGNGTIEIGWLRPSTQTSQILDYTVTWPGGQVVVPGSQTTAIASGLDNNQRYAFTVKAQNRVGYSPPRTSLEMQSLGTPLPPDAPTVVDLETGVNQSNFRIAWSAVLPEGAGPTAYTVNYSDGSTSAAVPGCQKLTTLVCTHTNVPYNGQAITYTVVAANQPAGEQGNRSAPSVGTTIQAVGRPAAWGAFTVRATGTSQEGLITYTVPDSRGETSNVEIIVAGQTVRSFQQEYGTQTRSFQTQSNEQPYVVQLRVCNEDAPVGCTLSGQQTVQTYGGVGDTIRAVYPTVQGRNIVWTIEGTSNGDPVVVNYELKNRNGAASGVRVFRPSGPGAYSFTTDPFPTEFYEQTQEIFVTVNDDSPGGRGEDSETRGVLSGPPPPPTVVASREGAFCNDDPASGAAETCQDSAIEQPCTDPSCRYLNLRITFAEGAKHSRWTCTFDKFQFAGGVNTRDVSGNGPYDGSTWAYYSAQQDVHGSCYFDAYDVRVSFP